MTVYMTRVEFIQRIHNRKEISNRTGRWAAIALLMLVLVGFGTGMYMIDLNREASWQWFILGLFAAFFGILLMAANYEKKMAKKIGPDCPACGKAFVGLSAQVVAASGRCGKCGAVVLEDWKQ
jgi:hypothetical protein